jgi:hypothetical protein
VQPTRVFAEVIQCKLRSVMLRHRDFCLAKHIHGFGLFDMLGNVWEWVNDWYDQNYYQNSLSQDPSGPANGTERVLRGGSWGSPPRYVRVSNRRRCNPGSRNDFYGFRCEGKCLLLDYFPFPPDGFMNSEL